MQAVFDITRTSLHALFHMWNKGVDSSDIEARRVMENLSASQPVYGKL